LEVAIQHVIGTVAILFLTISIGVAFTSVSSFVETDISEKAMAQVAAHVSVNLVEIATLTNSSNYDINLTKTIDLPAEAGGRAYYVELVNATDEGKGYLVRVSLVSQPRVNVNSTLPFNSSTTVDTVVVATTQLPALGTTIVRDTYPEITYVDSDMKAIIFGGTEAAGRIPVVWAVHKDGILYMGIGWYRS
jgi:hypothetical protein